MDTITLRFAVFCTSIVVLTVVLRFREVRRFRFKGLGIFTEIEGK